MTAETQTRICSVVPAVTTGPAASVWTRVDAHSTAAERPGCTAASSAAAWSVHKSVTHHTQNYMCFSRNENRPSSLFEKKTNSPL